MNNLAAILDNINAGVYVSDPHDSRLLYANEKLLKQCGLTLSEACQKPCWEVARWTGANTSTRTGKCELCPCGRLLEQSGLTKDEEIVWESRDNRAERYFSNASRLIKWSGTHHTAHLCYITDVTESKKLQEHNNKIKSEFLSRVSHEILTPMNAVVGMTRIASASDDIEKTRGCLAKIDNASMQLLDIIKSIMDLSRLEHGRLTLVRSVFSFSQMLAGLCEEIEVPAAEKSQDLTVNIGDDLPGFLRTDEGRLRQILYNLLTNAIKFTPAGGRIGFSVSVDGMDAKKKKADIMFSVSDSGIGISEDDRERLFLAFEQFDGSHSRSYGGLGLGLTIAARLTKLFGGEIALKSKLGEGSVFSFKITADIADFTGVESVATESDDLLRYVSVPSDIEVQKPMAANVTESDVSKESVQSAFLKSELELEPESEPVLDEDQASEASKSRQQVLRAGSVYASFMPSFDVASAMRVLRGNKKLYSTMLKTLKSNTQFGEMRAALRHGDSGAIVKLLRPLTGISKNLCLSEMSETLVKINTMVRYHVIPEALCNRYDSVMDDVYRNMDKLTDMLAN